MNYLLSYNPQIYQDIEEILSFLVDIHPELPRRFRSLLAEKLEETGRKS